MAPTASSTDMRVPPAAARWMVQVLGSRSPDPNTLLELLQCESGLNNLILRDLKFIWSEMEESFQFVKMKHMRAPHASVPCKSDKKTKFISRLRRFFYIDAECTMPDPAALQEVMDVTAGFATAAPVAVAVAATAPASAPPAAAASEYPSFHSASALHRLGGSSPAAAAAAATRSIIFQGQPYRPHQHQPQQCEQYGASLASSNRTSAAVGNSSNPMMASSSASATTSSGNARHSAAPSFYPYLGHHPHHQQGHHPHHQHQHHQHHHRPAGGAAAAGGFSTDHSRDDTMINNNPQKRPYSQAFSSSSTVANNDSSHLLQQGLEAMLRQFEMDTNNTFSNTTSHSRNNTSHHSANMPPGEGGNGGSEAQEEDESLRPQNATEASILAALQEYGFNDTREVLEGIRRLTTQNAANNIHTPPSMDDVMVDLVTQREEMADAKQVDEARLASEALRKEEAKRRRENIAAELKERRLEAPLQEWRSDFFSNSWILSTSSFYAVLDKCMMPIPASNRNSDDNNNSSTEETRTSTTKASTTTNFRDALFELLDTEKNSRQWYKCLPRAYFTALVCKRLVDAGENSETLTKQLVVESETLKKELFSLSEQTQGGVPRIFLEAHEEFGSSAAAGGSDTENKNMDNADDDDDDDVVEVLRRVESNTKGTSSSSPSPQKKARRCSSPNENDGDVIDLS